MPIFGSSISLTNHDKIDITEKVTQAYFSNGAATLNDENIVTSSIDSTNAEWYQGISITGSSYKNTPEFHVAYGNVNGYGSLIESAFHKGETEAIYKSLAQTLLAPTEITGGFFISRNTGTTSVPSSPAIASGRDTEIYAVIASRANKLDRVNKKNWTIVMSGSNGAGTLGSQTLHLTDDSIDENPTATIAGDRYNIVSGSDGTVVVGASVTTYGFFYPDQGVMLFSGAELSASMAGSGSQVDTAAVFGPSTDAAANKFRGFGTTTNTDADYRNSLRFINCLQPNGTKLTFRKEEDEISKQFFCRVRAGEYNFSNNPTWVSGSNNEIRQKSMWNFPVTYITGVQLYNAAGDVVAVGKLSTPLKKNFSTEATIKVKLTY
jgi:hypothetical protein